MVVAVIAVVLWTIVAIATAPACRRSEFSCENGRCVPLNRYCDAANDCGDSSDEPRQCTPCNRTYLGDVGKTYELELHRPREDRLPFICHLKFEAGGDDLGDLVQLTFDSFTLGRFVSFTADGCPDGSLQISEADRPVVGGSWCGTSWGAALYYSETRTVSLSLRLTRLARDQTGYNFDYRMGYKMLPKTAAIVRYGGTLPGTLHTVPQSNTTTPTPLVTPVSAPTLTEIPTTKVTPTAPPKYYLGDLMAGTYCSRIFSDCDRKACRLQSPNFPGIYPRNLTCYYAVRQHDVPPGKQALIAVRQPKGQLVAIRSQSALYGPSSQQQQHRSRELKVWTECDDVQDYVTVYDGYTTRDAVLLKFCGGGEAVPEAVSSGPELLVEFTSSPYGTFLYPAPLQALHGFQLEVQVRFVDQQSPTYARNKRCEFWVRGTNKGTLETPQHSLPRNTTCLYHLQGVDITAPRYPPEPGFWRREPPPPRYRVWLSILKFHVSSTIDPQLQEEEECASQLKVWDGVLRVNNEQSRCNDIFCDNINEKDKLTRIPTVLSASSGSNRLFMGPSEPANATLLATYCKDQVPRSCDHSLLSNSTRSPRPCSLAESFLSSGDSLTLELRLAESTALRPVSFRALYEFVDLHQDGEPYGTGSCSRKFVSRSQGPVPEIPQKFQNPKNVFLYGRGGSPNISCVYRFEAQRGERVKIRITRLQTGGRRCPNMKQPDLGRFQCHSNCTASLRIYDQPWTDTPPLARDCLCSSTNGQINFTFVSTAHVVEVRFVVTNMNASDDFRNFNFEGSWEFIRTPVCPRKQRLSGASGEIRFKSPSNTPEEVNCENHPWLIEPSAGRYLYVKLRGISLQQQVISSELENITVTTRQIQHEILCGTKNRIALHSGGSVHVVVCPQPPSSQRHHIVEVFSEGWVISSTKLVHQPVLSTLPTSEQQAAEQSRSVIVEFLAQEAGSYSLTWLELARRRSVLPPAGYVMEDCLHRCPELDACINSSLWCDGISHCPSGFDEAAIHCSFILQLPLLYLALGAAGIIVICCSLCLIACSSCRRRRRSKLHRRIKSLPTDAASLGKEVIC